MSLLHLMVLWCQYKSCEDQAPVWCKWREVLMTYNWADCHSGLCFPHCCWKILAPVFLYFFFIRMAYRSVDKLCNASASGKLAEVLTLLQNGADVNGFNTFNRTALQVGTYTSFTLVLSSEKECIFFLIIIFCRL